MQKDVISNIFGGENRAPEKPLVGVGTLLLHIIRYLFAATFFFHEKKIIIWLDAAVAVADEDDVRSLTHVICKTFTRRHFIGQTPQTNC